MTGDDQLLADLCEIVSQSSGRNVSIKAVAALIRHRGRHRWVGLYDVRHDQGVVTNIAWDGPGAPQYPSFPSSKGLTGAAIASRKTVNVGDVAADPRYLTAFGSTRSEIIVPVFTATGEAVAGTIDVESDRPHAFDSAAQALLEACAEIIQPLWR